MLVFEESTLRKLERLSLVASQVRVGVMKGERRSRKRGTSIEFADYRDYTQGDDLRRLDWNIYARLERPFVKLLEEEEDLAVHLLVDASGSMDWPKEEEETNKFHYALRLAAALGYIGLGVGDQVIVSLLRSDGNPSWGPHRSRQSTLSLMQFLENSTSSGITALNVALTAYATRGRRPGLLFLISDLFSPAGYEKGLDSLQARGYEVSLVHLLSPDEVDPPLAGDVKLVDAETGDEAEISLDVGTLSRYRLRVNNWQSQISDYCRRRGVHYVPVITDLPWERLIMQSLRVEGLVR